MRMLYAVILWSVLIGACPYAETIKTEARKANLPPETIVLIVLAESSCNPNAHNKGENARGLFQFSQRTWESVSTLPFSQAWNPQANIEAGIAHLKLANTTNPKNLVAWHNAGVKDWTKLNPKWSVNHPNKIYRRIYNGK